MKYICELCGSIYDEQIGGPKHGIPAGTPFSQLSQEHECPVCGSGKEAFSKLESKAQPTFTSQEAAAFWQETKYSDSKHVSER